MSAMPKPLSEVLTQRVLERCGRRVRNLVVEVALTGDAVTLRGRASSFHVKQLAQQGVRDALPAAMLDNAIVVE